MARMTPDHYARTLLHTLGYENLTLTATDTRSASTLWAESGAQFLTGTPEGPPLPCPAPLASCARGAWLALAELANGALDPQFPAHQLLGERAALLGLQRRGAVSPGGACRLLDCSNEQLALNLPRTDDWTLLPAWLEHPVESWDDIARSLRSRDAQTLVDRGRLLGLAVALSRPPQAAAARQRPNWYRADYVRSADAKSADAKSADAKSADAQSADAQPTHAPRTNRPLVIDLSSLWAGPLCTQLLGDMGARVIKVESLSRPDGARLGPSTFFNLLNGAKQSVALDLSTHSGRRQLRALLACADIVVESARPRGLEQMGVVAADIAREGAGRVWLSITGYGRAAPMRDWIAYGDDAGVAAGLSWLLREHHGQNLFCADAIADPLSGLHAALLAWAVWSQGGGAVLDISLCDVLEYCIASGATDSADDTGIAVAPPRARGAAQQAPPLGRDTADVLRELGIGY
jgi:crotonobetainyl-CoA:carnitine CoA-transferase CaiB-like acyl-CoA transferase